MVHKASFLATSTFTVPMVTLCTCYGEESSGRTNTASGDRDQRQRLGSEAKQASFHLSSHGSFHGLCSTFSDCCLSVTVSTWTNCPLLNMMIDRPSPVCSWHPMSFLFRYPVPGFGPDFSGLKGCGLCQWSPRNSTQRTGNTRV